MSYRVTTQAYSGPFDLLLQLVTRQKVDIGAISIAEVAEQYLEEVHRLEALDLDGRKRFLAGGGNASRYQSGGTRACRGAAYHCA